MKQIQILTIFLILNACAHHENVRPFADGIHKISIESTSQQNASQAALKQAEEFCRDTKQVSRIVEENFRYNGELDEKEYNENLKARGIGGDGSVQQYLAQKFAGTPYVCELKFKCVTPEYPWLKSIRHNVSSPNRQIDIW
jgi:hypothetical protein